MPSTRAGSGGAEAEHRGFWGAVASLTSLGWVMALPIVGGVLAGHYVDRRLGSDHLWTLGLLGVGVGVALLEVYLALRRALRSKSDA